VYGDGATYESMDRAGWGLYMRTEGGNGPVQEKDAKGRVSGKQSNDGAEAEAILQALLRIHPNERATFYCDNQGCVLKWGKLGKESTLRWGFRAIWNRIAALKEHRETSGSRMRMKWVHSHVDDETRRTQVTKKMECACRTNGENECDATHEHHIGNTKADLQAKDGAFYFGSHQVADVARGDLRYVLGGSNGVAQGGYGEWMKREMCQADIKTAAAEPVPLTDKGKRTRAWARGATITDQKVRASVVKRLHSAGGTSWRFWIRASLQSLPTMSQMAKFRSDDGMNAYARVYGDHIGEEGKCTTCEHHKETVEHSLWDCAGAKEEWERTDLETWHRWEKQGLDWDKYDWKRPCNQPPDWETLWGTLGMVPAELVERVAGSIGHIAAFTLVKATALAHLETASRVWDNRNKRQLEWEANIQSLSEEKRKAKTTVWSRYKGPAKSTRKRCQQQTGPETLEQCKAREGREEINAARDEAKREVASREIASNENRMRAGNPLMSAAQIIRLGDAEANARVLGLRKRLREEKQQRSARAEHVPLEDMQCTFVQITDAAPIALLHAKPQRGQVGWWVPTVGTQVEAFWTSNNGKESLGGTPGDWKHGKVSNVAWDEDALPCSEVVYPGGHREWHCTRTAGTALKLRKVQGPAVGGNLLLTDRMPEPVSLLLGPGAKLLVRWQTTRETFKWWNGVVVANDGARVAVRYDAVGKVASEVVWHTDLHDRGCRIMELVRMTPGANERYQLQVQRRAQECVLLTDDGKCECAWCFTTGWPREVDAMVDMGMDEDEAWDLRNMEPREGRQLILKRKSDSEPLPANPAAGNGTSDDGNTDADDRSMRAAKRSALCGPAPRSTGGQNKEAPERHRTARPSGQDQGVVSGRSGRRKGTPAGQRRDQLARARRAKAGGAPAEDLVRPNCDGRVSAEVGTGVPGSDGLGADLGCGERGASQEGGTGDSKEGETRAAQNGEAQTLELTRPRVPECDSDDAGVRGVCVPRSGPWGGGLDTGGSRVDSGARVDKQKRGGSGRRDYGTSGEDEADTCEQGRAQELGSGARPRGRVGVNRDSGSWGGVLDGGSGQRRSPVPGHNARIHPIQGTVRLCSTIRPQPVAKNSEESRAEPTASDGGLALTRVHPVIESEQHEHFEGVRTRAIRGAPGQPGCCDPRETAGGKSDVPEVQDGDRGATSGSGGGGCTICNREPEGQPFLGTGIGHGPPAETQGEELADRGGGPVRIRKEGPEGDLDLDEHRMEADGADWGRKVQSGSVLGDPGQHCRPARIRKARTADSGKQRREENQGGGGPKGREGTILRKSSKEQSGNNAGTRDPGGSKAAEDENFDEKEEGREGSKRVKLVDGKWAPTVHTTKKRHKGHTRDDTREQETREPDRKRPKETGATERKGIG
jgi:ribonuclease HI